MLSNGPYLRGWYPGIGEISVLNSFPRPVLEFIRDAANEDPEFIDGYLIPTLEQPDPLGEICDDLSDEVARLECERAGLGDIGYLGKSFLKKVTHAVRKVHQAIEKKIMPKAIQKIEQKVAKSEQHIIKAAKKDIKKVWIKYGPIILAVVGGIVTALTGPAGAAAFALLQAANTAYMKKRQADAAKKAGRAEAASMQADAAAADVALNQQLNDFYNQNQNWFIQNGMTPDNWAKLSTQQKIAFIDAASKGQLPPGAVQVPEGTSPSGGSGMQPGGYMPTSGGGYGQADPGAGYAPPAQPTPGGGYPWQGPMPTPSEGGGDRSGVWGGQGIGPSGATSSYQPGGGPQQPATAQASMFGDTGGMLLPALALGAAIMFFGKKTGSGSRRRRNPSRRRRAG